eukprot:357392-Chlamydomonas_euryale.AAC.44
MREADPCAKALVFSQFTSMLELVYHRLTQVRPAVCIEGWVCGRGVVRAPRLPVRRNPHPTHAPRCA